MNWAARYTSIGYESYPRKGHYYDHVIRPPTY